MSSEPRLTPTSYVVLGLIATAGEATPYDLKRAVTGTSIGDLWNLPHAQVYAEPGKLAAAGLLDEEVETTGRRRKTYRLTKAGRAALDAWLAEPTAEFTQLRDPGLLKLFFGADPEPLARVQLEIHERKLAEYEELARAELPRGVALTLDSGIGHEREWVRFWSQLTGRK